jgi:hypothetical protein
MQFNVIPRTSEFGEGFDRVPRKVIEWALRKKGVNERRVRAVMQLYEGANTKVKVGKVMSDAFTVKVGVHQGSVLSQFFAIVMDVVCGDVMDRLRKFNHAQYFEWTYLVSLSTLDNQYQAHILYVAHNDLPPMSNQAIHAKCATAYAFLSLGSRDALSLSYGARERRPLAFPLL